MRTKICSPRNVYYLILVLLLVASMACKKKSDNPTSSDNNNNNNNNSSLGDFTGNFLAWTGSDDAAHYFCLVRINGTNGNVTNIGGTRYFRDLEYGPDGTLYGIGSSLYSINQSTGVETLIGSFHTSSVSSILMGGAAFSPNGTLYVRESSTDQIYTVNLTNGALTPVGTPDALMEDFEFASNGTLYAAFADLYTLNSADFSTKTDIASFSDGVYISMMTFGKNGVLYGMDYFPSTALYSINTSTGALTKITDVQSSGISALLAERAVTTHKIADVHHAQEPVPTDAELRAMEAKGKADQARHMHPVR